MNLEERVKKYRSLTEKALKKISIKNNLSFSEKKKAQQLIKMANDYFSDACFFEKQKNFDLSLAAFSYAHAWLDAGVKLKLLDGKEDSGLFTLP